MPYQSRKQAAYLHIHEPELAAEWDKKYYGKKKGRVSKMQPRYGGAGTRGRRISGDDSALEKRDDWMNISEHERRARDSRRTHNRGTVVAAAGGVGGAMTIQANRDLRQMAPGTKNVPEQMSELGRNFKLAVKHRKDVPLKESLPAIARRSPHGAAGAASTAALGTGIGMRIGGRINEKRHTRAIGLQRRQRAETGEASKRYPDKDNPKTAAHRTHEISSRVGGAAALTAIGTGIAGGYDDQFENINRHANASAHMKFENETARMKGFKGRWTRGQRAAVHGIIAGQNMRKRPLGAVTTGAQATALGALPVAIGASSKYGKEVKARAAKTRAENRAKKLAAAAPTESASKAAPRYYDDENRRQRRLGQYQGVLGLGGVAAAGEGGRRIYQDTKNLRDLTVREDPKGATARPGVHVPLRSSKAGKGAVSLKKLPVGLVAGGVAGVGGATVIRRHAESNRGAPYR